MNALDLFDINKETKEFKVKIDKGFRGLFVGRSGSGKSTAEMSFPEPIYDFDMDNRFRGAISSIKWLGKEKFSKIDFDPYNPNDGFEAVDKKLNGFVEDANKRQLKYKTVLFDSFGSLCSMLLLDSQRLRGIRASQDKNAGQGKVRGVLQFLHPDDYNYLSTALRLIMFNRIFPLNELGINTVFSSWVVDKYERGEKEFDPPKIVGERLLGPGNIVEEAMGYFDEVYYFSKQAKISGATPQFHVQFETGFARTSLGLPTDLFNITGKSFYDLWKGEVEKSVMKGL